MSDIKFTGTSPNIFLLIGVLLWIHSVITSKPVYISPSYVFGLIEALPYTYILSLIFVVVSIVINVFESKRKMLFYIQLFALITIVWQTVTIQEDLPRQWDGYTQTHYAFKIVQYGLIPDNISYGYYGWPGNTLIIAFLAQLSNIISSDFLSQIQLLKIWQILITPLIFLTVYSVYVKIGFKELWIGELASTIYVLTTYDLHLHTVPQTVAQVLFPIAFLLSYIIYFNQNQKNVIKYRILNIVIIASLIVTHPTSTFILMIYYIFIVIFTFVNSIKTSDYKTCKKMLNILILFSVIFIAWNLLESVHYTGTSLVERFVSSISSIISTEAASSVANDVIARNSIEPRIPTLIKTIYTIIAFLFSFICLSYLSLIKQKLVPFYALTTACIIYIIITNLSFGSGLSDRAVYFNSLSSSFLVAYVLITVYRKNKIGRIISLCVILSLTIVTLTTFSEECALSNFVNTAIGQEYGNSLKYGDYYQGDQIQLLEYGYLKKFDDHNNTIIITDKDRWTYDRYKKLDIKNMVIISAKYNKVFDSPTVDVYSNQLYYKGD